MNADCYICSLEDAEAADRVFSDELWAAEVASGFEVPGWFFLRTRRHAEKLTGLNDAEAEALGFRARALMAAIEEVTGAPAVYLMSFGENYRHYHAIIIARGEEISPEERSAAILQRGKTHVDAEAARAVTAQVRRAYAALM